MIEAIRLIKERGGINPVCVAVHGLFADNSDALLAQAGARVVTPSQHPSAATNQLGESPTLAQ